MAVLTYPKKQKDKYLTEMDHYINRKSGYKAHIVGCMVRIPNVDGKLKHKFFSVGKSAYKSMRAAKIAARVYRDKELVKIWGIKQARVYMNVPVHQPVGYESRRQPRSVPISRSDRPGSGVVGISFLAKRWSINEQDGWKSSWSEDSESGKRKQIVKRFTWTRYGKEIAFLEAAMYRARHVDRLVVYSYDELPVSKSRLSAWLKRAGLPNFKYIPVK